MHTHMCMHAQTYTCTHIHMHTPRGCKLLAGGGGGEGQSCFPASPSPPQRDQPPAEQPAAPTGRASSRSRAGRTPALGWHVLAQAHRTTICSADAFKTSNGPRKWGFSTFPLPGGAQAPGVPWWGVPGPTWTTTQPTPNRPCPPGPAVLQLEPGSDAAGGAAPRPALPAPPNQLLSKGWSSKIFSRAPSVYHTVNLGFQQLYDAAGRWERTKKRCFALSDTACVCQCPPAPGQPGDRPRLPGG